MMIMVVVEVSESLLAVVRGMLIVLNQPEGLGEEDSGREFVT